MMWSHADLMYQSIPSLTATPGDSHILGAPGVGLFAFCSSVLPGGLPGGS